MQNMESKSTFFLFLRRGVCAFFCTFMCLNILYAENNLQRTKDSKILQTKNTNKSNTSKNTNKNTKKVSVESKKNTKQDSKKQTTESKTDSFRQFSLPNFKDSKIAGVLYSHILLDFNTSKVPKNRILKHISVSKIGNNMFEDSTKVCERLLISGLQDLQKEAIKLNGTKVLNITTFSSKNASLDSNKNAKKVSKNRTFNCEVGTIFSKVTLQGDIVK